MEGAKASVIRKREATSRVVQRCLLVLDGGRHTHGDRHRSCAASRRASEHSPQR